MYQPSHDIFEYINNGFHKIYQSNGLQNMLMKVFAQYINEGIYKINQ